MVALPQVFETASLPEGTSKPVVDPGQYKAVIVNSELKPTKDGAGQFLALTIILTDGKFANTEFTERLNIVNKNPDAVRIAYQTLARISEAVGMTSTPADSTALHNKPFLVDIITKQGDVKKDRAGNVEYDGTTPKRYADYSEIKKYLPLQAITSGQATAVVSASLPWKS